MRVKEQGGIRWLGSCKHPSQLRKVRAKARPFVQCCRWVRSSDIPNFSLWGGGQMSSQPCHSVSTSPSHHPGSGWEPLCWHRTFEGNRPNKREKRVSPTWKHLLPPTRWGSGPVHQASGGSGQAGEVFLPSLPVREPPEAPDLGQGCFPMTFIKNSFQ